MIVRPLGSKAVNHRCAVDSLIFKIMHSHNTHNLDIKNTDTNNHQTVSLSSLHFSDNKRRRPDALATSRPTQIGIREELN